MEAWIETIWLILKKEAACYRECPGEMPVIPMMGGLFVFFRERGNVSGKRFYKIPLIDAGCVKNFPDTGRRGCNGCAVFFCLED